MCPTAASCVRRAAPGTSPIDAHTQLIYYQNRGDGDVSNGGSGLKVTANLSATVQF
jgi:hypothetical protein